MAHRNEPFSICSIRRFPQSVREELNRFLSRNSWQSLTREFSVDIIQGATAQALDDVPNFIASEYPEFREDVRTRLSVLKNSRHGKTQSFKGKSRVGFHSYFYRFWLVARQNADGLYDIVFCHICRKEEFDFLLCMKKVIRGVSYTIASAPQAVMSALNSLSPLGKRCLDEGNFCPDTNEEQSAPETGPPGSPYSELTQDLGDRLTEYELVEDLISRGTLVESPDGTLAIQLH